MSKFEQHYTRYDKTRAAERTAAASIIHRASLNRYEADMIPPSEAVTHEQTDDSILVDAGTTEPVIPDELSKDYIDDLIAQVDSWESTIRNRGSIDDKSYDQLSKTIEALLPTLLDRLSAYGSEYIQFDTTTYDDMAVDAKTLLEHIAKHTQEDLELDLAIESLLRCYSDIRSIVDDDTTGENSPTRSSPDYTELTEIPDLSYSLGRLTLPGRWKAVTTHYQDWRDEDDNPVIDDIESKVFTPQYLEERILIERERAERAQSLKEEKRAISKERRQKLKAKEEATARRLAKAAEKSARLIARAEAAKIREMGQVSYDLLGPDPDIIQAGFYVFPSGGWSDDTLKKIAGADGNRPSQERQYYESRLMGLRSLGEASSDNGDAPTYTLATRGLSGSRNAPYLILGMKYGGGTYHVAECAESANATYIFREGTDGQSWSEVFTETKQGALDLGAERVVHGKNADDPVGQRHMDAVLQRIDQMQRTATQAA